MDGFMPVKAVVHQALRRTRRRLVALRDLCFDEAFLEFAQKGCCEASRGCRGDADLQNSADHAGESHARLQV